LFKKGELLPLQIHWVTIGAIVFLIVFPLLNPGEFYINVGWMLTLYAYLALGWNLLSGFAGQFSLGYAAYFGIGAYTAGVLYMRFGLTPWLGMVLGPILAAALALAVGYPTFKLRHHYYSLASLALSEVMRLVFLSWDYVGGAYGIWYHPILPFSWIDFQFNADHRVYYYLTLVMLIGALLLTWKIRNSDFGLRLLAIRNDEEAAESLGINALTHKLKIAAISAGLGAAAGVMYAQFTLFIEPDSTMSIAVTMDILLPVMLGGLGTTYGPLLGALILIPLSWLTRIFIGSTLQIVVRGVILMLIVVFMPDGLMKVVIDKYYKPKLVGRGKENVTAA